MGSEHTEDRSVPAITYPDLASWAEAYKLSPERATEVLRHLALYAFGKRPGLLSSDHRRCYLDIHRFVTVIDQLTTLKERDVFALSFRCPARMQRYRQALQTAITEGMGNGAGMKEVEDGAILLKALDRFVEEVTSFYQGLS